MPFPEASILGLRSAYIHIRYRPSRHITCSSERLLTSTRIVVAITMFDPDTVPPTAEEVKAVAKRVVSIIRGAGLDTFIIGSAACLMWNVSRTPNVRGL